MGMKRPAASGGLKAESFIVCFRGEDPNVFYIKKGDPLTINQVSLLKRSMNMDNTEILKRWQSETDIIKSDVLSDLRNVSFFEITNTNNTEELKRVVGTFLYNNKVVTDAEVKAALQNQNQVELTLKVTKNQPSASGKQEKKEAILGTLKMAVTTNGSTFKVVCKRKDYPNKEYQNFMNIGESDNGEALLDQGETIELTLQEQDDKGNWNEVANALWQADNDASANTTTKYIPVIDDKISYVAVKKDNNSSEIRIYFKVEPTSITPSTTYTFVGLVPDVTQLAPSDQNKAQSKFTTAMTAINTKEPTLYTTVTNNGLTVKVYIVPKIYVEENGSMVEKPNLAGQTSRQTITQNTYTQLSVDMFEFEGEATPVSIDQLVEGAYKNKVVKGAKLVTALLTDERINIADASNKKDVNWLRTDIRNKIRALYPSLEAELVTKVQNGTVDDVFIDKLKYEVSPAKLYKFCMLGTSYDVHLNNGHPLVNGKQRDFTKVLAHEFKHIDFGISNFYEIVRWDFIRNASTNNGESLFDLKNSEGYNGSCGCSAGSGHEKNNPENCVVCGEEKNY
jgi:hypothetical protein